MRAGPGKSRSILQDIGDDILLQPLIKTSARYYLYLLFFLGIIFYGGYNYLLQLLEGLGVTGLNRPVYWGVYISNFVFFIGISHAGTLISAILRVAQAEWRRPITRCAEAITVFALCIGAPQVLIDIGRLDRVLNILEHSRFGSPLLWDVVCINTYLLSSITYLYLPLIPDMALCRDRMPRSRYIKRFFYNILALGWVGTEKQKHYLEKVIGFMAVIIIPIAVSVHTVVSWIFAMTIQPMWHSTILGPYFVIGAIFTGIACLLIAMAILRKVYRLENYFQPLHFNNLGSLLITMTALWAYATLAEYLTTFYGAEPAHLSVFYGKFSGTYAPIFWITVASCFFIPLFFLVAFRQTHPIAGAVIASISINIGMWLERYTIIVPTLMSPRLPYEVSLYYPTLVEWAITAGSFSILVFLYMLFVKLFPIVSIWEVEEGREIKNQEKQQTLREAGVAVEQVSKPAFGGMSFNHEKMWWYHLAYFGLGVMFFGGFASWLGWVIFTNSTTAVRIVCPVFLLLILTIGSKVMYTSWKILQAGHREVVRRRPLVAVLRVSGFDKEVGAFAKQLSARDYETYAAEKSISAWQKTDYGSVS